MSLINAFGNCCCDEIGHCCCFNPSDEQNCFGCLDDKTKAQCEAAIGCRWVAGTCAENPCLGACCTTDASDCFVDCVSGVTECECFFEHQTAENTATFTAGASVTCEQVGCPCTCNTNCGYQQWIEYTETHHGERSACPDGGNCFTSIDDVYVTHGFVSQNEDGSTCGIYTAAELIALWAASSITSSGGCDDVNPYYFVNNTIRTATLGPLVKPTGCSNAAQIQIGNDSTTVSKVFTCTSGCGFSWCVGFSGSTIAPFPVYATPIFCNVCDQIGCTHQCEPCVECP